MRTAKRFFRRFSQTSKRAQFLNVIALAILARGSGDAVVDICRHSPFRGSGSGRSASEDPPPRALFPQTGGARRGCAVEPGRRQHLAAHEALAAPRRPERVRVRFLRGVGHLTTRQRGSVFELHAFRLPLARLLCRDLVGTCGDDGHGGERTSCALQKHETDPRGCVHSINSVVLQPADAPCWLDLIWLEFPSNMSSEHLQRSVWTRDGALSHSRT